MNESSDDLVQRAKVAEQAERYDDMSNDMTELVKLKCGSNKDSLTDEERNLLSVAYKNVVGARRSSWRVISSIEAKPSDDTRKNAIAKEYRERIEKELREICKTVLELIKTYLIPSAESEGGPKDALVFYRKMEGDYYRYLAEVACVDQRNGKTDDAECARKSYCEAQDRAVNMPATHPIKLGLALNHSVFHYEILNEPGEARKLAQNAFEHAMKDLEDLSESSYKDSTLIMQLLKDNLTLWTSDTGDDAADD